MSFPVTTRGPQTAADWTAANPTLDQFEIGIEVNPATGSYGPIKIGDGRTAWNDLPYAVGTPVSTQAGTSYTLTPADSGRWIRFTSGSAVTVTFPVGLGVGFNCLLKMAGTGTVTVQGDGTSSVVNVDGLYSISGQHGIMTVFADVANIATVSGNLA